MPVQTYSRLALAQEQLETALALFLDKTSFASSITLAGAAEEVLARELCRRSGTPVLDWKFEQVAVVHELLHGTALQRKDFRKSENRIRNALKHLDVDEDPTIDLDIEEAACWMLVRACENASRLDLTLKRRAEFDEWFYSEIVGI